jgi:hypothetical protein
MDFDKFNTLPAWEKIASKYFLDDDDEAWKKKPYWDAAEKMYNSWREVYSLVIAFADNIDEKGDEGHAGYTKIFICENAEIVGPKIAGALGADLYVLNMENAAIIRTNCRQMMEQVGFAVLMGWAEKEHKTVIAQTLDNFKSAFKIWVATFEKDEFEDEWGLF